MLDFPFCAGWREPSDTTELIRQRIAFWLCDGPSPLAVLSLRALVAAGVQRGVTAGQWFGPNDACQALRYARIVCLLLSACMCSRLSCRHSAIVNSTPYLNGLLRVAVFNTGALFTETVHTMCIPGPGIVESPVVGDATEPGRPEWQSAALILVVLRLGLEGINPEYIPSLQRILAIPHCIGLLGGTPRHSIYCVGTAGDDVLFLDPHTTQRAWTPTAPACSSDPIDATAVDGESCLQIDGASTRAEDASSASPACVGLQAPPEMPASYINSFRCHRPLFTPLKSLDPSLAIAIHCRNRKEFDELCVELQTAFSSETTPLFSVSAVEPVYEDAAGDADVMYFSDKDDAHDALNPQESSYFGPTGAGTDALTLDTPFVYQEEPSDDEGYVMVHSSMVTNEI